MESQQEESSKPVESPNQEINPQPAEAPKQGKNVQKSSNMGLIIVIIVLAVTILGVGGFFGGRYLYNKYIKKSTSTTTTTQTGKTSIKTVIDALMYPGSTIEFQEQDAAISLCKLILNSSDSVETIKAYYQKLAVDKKWTVTSQSASGAENFSITLTDGVFTAEIDDTRFEGDDITDITIRISGDTLLFDGIATSPTSATKTVSATSQTSKTSGDYIISDTNARVISESELTNLTPWHLKVARNEIYARHGREFVHKDLQCYFAKKSWYGIDPLYSESALSTTENKNVATILAYEEKINSPLLQTDSGCDTNS